MERDPGAEREYGLFIKSVIDEHRLLPFDRTAVARVVEFSSRLAEDQNKLSTRFGKIADLVREASYWAKKGGQDRVTSVSIQTAIDESIYRNNLIEERLQEMVAQETILIDTRGMACGQINGLSVLSLGDYAFGRPCRITASVHPGQGGVLDIERQARLGGPVHTKGVLILSGFIGGRYGLSRPLNLTASLTFEQSYDEVEGDSASAAEAVALLSAIAGVPVRQDRALTGSINQHGQIQAIGGVNEKIEGFFAACQTGGLTGEQGVLIPAANHRHLMLRADVVAAVAAGRFHIWPVTCIDQVLSLLSGLEPGKPDEQNTYPEGTFNHRIVQRLDEFARLVGPGKPENKPAGTAVEPDQPGESMDRQNLPVE